MSQLNAFAAQGAAWLEKMLNDRPSLTLLTISLLLFVLASALDRIGKWSTRTPVGSNDKNGELARTPESAATWVPKS